MSLKLPKSNQKDLPSRNWCMRVHATHVCACYTCVCMLHMCVHATHIDMSWPIDPNIKTQRRKLYKLVGFAGVCHCAGFCFSSVGVPRCKARQGAQRFGVRVQLYDAQQRLLSFFHSTQTWPKYTNIDKFKTQNLNATFIRIQDINGFTWLYMAVHGFTTCSSGTF